jgi:hypothetical protein
MKNDLRFTRTVVRENGEQLVIKIRLNDECKNGHQDFSITGDLYEGSGRDDRSFISGGCIHEEILQDCPEYKLFIDLHLCDYNGIPMHAVANGYYHLSQGEMTKEKYCEYYRITSDIYYQLKDSPDQLHFGYMLKKLGVLDIWKAEALEGISILESLTGEKFLNDSKRSQYSMTEDELKRVEELIAQGYYTPSEVEERKEKDILDKKSKKIKDAEESFENILKNARIDLTISLIAVELFGTRDNIIYYPHTNECVLNWYNSCYTKRYSETEFKMFLDVAKEHKVTKDLIFKLK